MIFVTGATGFLGGAFVGQLLAAGGTEIRALARIGADATGLERLAAEYGPGRLTIIRGDLASPRAAHLAIGDADRIFHLAAGTSGSAADLFMSSVVASRNLLEALVPRSSWPKIVLVSSMGVYRTAHLPRGARVDEDTPLEDHPERRDLYSQAKLRQERLFWEYRDRYQFPLVTVRPGVIYGPGGTPISARVGMSLAGIFLHLGGRNLLPLTYVENCAEAIVAAGTNPAAVGRAFNVIDSDLPTCEAFLRQYRREVAALRVLHVPYSATLALSWLCEKYHVRSEGQLPAFFTRYRSKTSWAGNQFDNSRLRGLGWRQTVPTAEGLRRTFAVLAARP